MSHADQQIAIDTCISLLKSGKQVKIMMSGSSMFPFIKDGETCIIDPITNYEELQKGDILVFGNKQKLVAHRLLRIREQNGKKRFFCKGDSRIKSDPVITSESILGKVVAIIKNGEERKIDGLKKNRFIARVSIYLIPFYYLYWGIKKLFAKRHNLLFL